MEVVGYILGLVTVAALGGFLYVKHAGRMLGPSEPRHPALWTGKAMDFTPLKPRIDSVRHDYLAARPASRGICYHRALLGLMRQTVAHLAYFRDRASRPEA